MLVSRDLLYLCYTLRKVAHVKQPMAAVWRMEGCMGFWPFSLIPVESWV